MKCVQFLLLQKSLHPTAPHVVPCCLINDLMLLFRQQAGTQHERNYLIDIYQNYIRIKSQLLKKQYIYRNRVCFGIHMAQFRYSGIAHWQHSCGERSLNPHILQVLKDERSSYIVHKACCSSLCRTKSSKILRKSAKPLSHRQQLAATAPAILNIMNIYVTAVSLEDARMKKKLISTPYETYFLWYYCYRTVVRELCVKGRIVPIR